MTQSLTYQAKRLECTFTDLDDTPVNPDEITLKIYRQWQGNTDLIETKAKTDLETSGTGVFYYWFTPGDNGPGRYTARFTTDNGVDVEESWDVSAGVTT